METEETDTKDSLALSPEDWANRWRLKLRETIPVPGLASAATWQGTALGTTRAPGKNHPQVGAWLVERYCRGRRICVDPMLGAGGLWLRTTKTSLGNASLQGCEIEETLYGLAKMNIETGNYRSTNLFCADALEWEPSDDASLVLFSPPFLQNHSAGATKHQIEIMERKSLHTMQEFGKSPKNIGRRTPSEFWKSMAILYKNIHRYLHRNGCVVVILRNRIKNGTEIDEIGRHINLMMESGLVPVAVHPRELLRPTGYQAWKLARNPDLPWVKYEWVVVAQS